MRATLTTPECRANPLPRMLIVAWIHAVGLTAVFAQDQSPPPTDDPKAAPVATAPEIVATDDPMSDLQTNAVNAGSASWGHWGSNPKTYAAWNNHSNRLIPVYTFGIKLDEIRGAGSVYADPRRLEELYGLVPEGTLNPDAEYFDQTDIYRLQWQAIRAGKKRVILVVFDGMDWQTTYAAALYKNGKVTYTQGRGNGLSLQDYRGTETDFGFFVTSPLLGNIKFDVDAQTLTDAAKPSTGGYDATRGGATPWADAPSRDYLMGLDRSRPHTVTDSASSATSMTAGIKTYNAAINIDGQGNRVETIAHRLQRDHAMAIGVVTSVPISHATPAAAYSHNVSRSDYQDLARDLIGLPSISHRTDPLPGVDVLIGGGWGETKEKDAAQGANFIPPGHFHDPTDLERVSVQKGGRYVLVQRTAGQSGSELLAAAAAEAIRSGSRLLGVFGAKGGNLPLATANGNFKPAVEPKGHIRYSDADVTENPTLADMTVAALDVLETNSNGFWLMVEAGDVDWANHANNIDCSIGAVFSGDAAVAAIFEWVENRNLWDETAVIVTADHGHYLVLTDPAVIAAAGARAAELAEVAAAVVAESAD
jgi:alkaline phosphatase